MKSKCDRFEEYPVLKRVCTDDVDIIILFEKPRFGTVVYIKKCAYDDMQLGEHSSFSTSELEHHYCTVCHPDDKVVLCN